MAPEPTGAQTHGEAPFQVLIHLAVPLSCCPVVHGPILQSISPLSRIIEWSQTGKPKGAFTQDATPCRAAQRRKWQQIMIFRAQCEFTRWNQRVDLPFCHSTLGTLWSFELFCATTVFALVVTDIYSIYSLANFKLCERNSSVISLHTFFMYSMLYLNVPIFVTLGGSFSVVHAFSLMQNSSLYIFYLAITFTC